MPLQRLWRCIVKQLQSTNVRMPSLAVLLILSQAKSPVIVLKLLDYILPYGNSCKTRYSELYAGK